MQIQSTVQRLPEVKKGERKMTKTGQPYDGNQISGGEHVVVQREEEIQ